MSKVLGSSAEAIGKTPLVRLDRLTKFHNVKGTILAKLEYLIFCYGNRRMQNMNSLKLCGQILQ